jgi:excisionase family DNA binding protein
MSRERAGWQGLAAPGSGSQPAEKIGVPHRAGAVPVGTVSTASTGRGAPVVRNVVRPVGPPMLTVREVAEELAVCRATVYALLERGELERVWVGRSIRIPAASLEALLARGRR